MAWNYTTGVLASSGATEATPDSLLAGIAVVQAADSTRGYRDGLVAWLNNVEVRVEGTSFIAVDIDSQIDLRGSSFINPQSGGVIHDFRSTLIISTSTARIDSALDFATGATLISKRQRPNDPSPRIVYNTATRHDYPNIQSYSTPAKVNIAGLDLYGKLGGGGSIKVYFGLATISTVENVRFFSSAVPQQFSTTYNDGYYEVVSFDSQAQNNTVTQNRPTYYRASPTNITGAIRAASFILNNPTFLNNCWTGAVVFATDLTASSRLSISYSYSNTFKSGLTNLENVNVRFTRARQSVNGSPTWTAPNATITATSNASGTYTAVSLLDAYREGTSTTDLERFNWTAKARRYDKKTAGETIFATRVLYRHSVNMSAGYSEEVQMLDVAGLTLSQSDAAALTGISFVASGATSGTATITENRTAAELWAAYRNWISQTANFDSEDAWSFAGTGLNVADWNVVVDAATFTGNLTTTSAVTLANGAAVNGIILDANNAGSISVTGVGAGDTAEMRKASDSSLIATRTGPGSFSISPANVGASVYFVRLTGANVVMSTLSTPTTLTAGVNPDVPMFAGAEVQVAQAARIDLLPTLAEIEASPALAKEATSRAIKSTTSIIPYLLVKD